MGMFGSSVDQIIGQKWSDINTFAEFLYNFLASIGTPQTPLQGPLTLGNAGQQPALTINQGALAGVDTPSISLGMQIDGGPSNPPAYYQLVLTPPDFGLSLGNFGGLGDIGGTNIGGLSTGNQGNINIQNPPFTIAPPQQSFLGGGGGRGGEIPGVVVSGTGTSYNVKIYTSGVDASPAATGAAETVIVTQLQPFLVSDINGNTWTHTIPPGTWVIVTKSTLDKADPTNAANPTQVVGGTADTSSSSSVAYFMQVPWPTSFPGKITGGGPGVTYNVKIYPSGVAATVAPPTVSVTQLQIAKTETIPVNTWTMVTALNLGSSAPDLSMQVPVWLNATPS